MKSLFTSLQLTAAGPWGASRAAVWSGRRPVFLIFGRACRILVRAHGSLAPGSSCPGGDLHSSSGRSRSGSDFKVYRSSTGRRPAPGCSAFSLAVQRGSFVRLNATFDPSMRTPLPPSTCGAVAPSAAATLAPSLGATNTNLPASGCRNRLPPRRVAGFALGCCRRRLRDDRKIANANTEWPGVQGDQDGNAAERRPPRIRDRRAHNTSNAAG